MPEPDAPAPAPPATQAAAVVQVGADGRVTAWSPAAERLLGRAEAQALGVPADEAVPGSDAWMPLAERAREGGDAGCTGPLAIGEGRWMEVTAVPDPSAAGAVLLVCGDVGEREAARRRDACLRQLAVELSATLEPREILHVLRTRAAQLLGADDVHVSVPGLEALGSHAGAIDRLPGAVLRRVRDCGEPAVLAAAGHPDGAGAMAEAPEGMGTVLLLPLRAAGAEPGALAITWCSPRPLTARVRALADEIAARAAVALDHAARFEALKEAAVRRDRFFSAMSHDLRTPITAIVGYSELLGDGIVGELEPRQLEMVERISQVAGHLSQLVNDILDLAKLDAGRMEFARDEVPLGALVEDAVVTIRPQAQSKQLALRLELEEHRDTLVVVDSSRVRQILVNLLSNAVKFTERGEVEVRAGRDGERGWITIRDTGPGLPAGSEEVVFEEFLQLASGNKAKREPGSGLGLAISRRLARAMGGDLTATNTAEGGAVFTLALAAAGPR